MSLLLIDGNNLAFRVAHKFKHLSYNGESVGLLYGFLKSIVSIKNKFPSNHTVIAWDSRGSSRRINESEEAVLEGITPGPYKGSQMHKRYDLEIKYVEKTEEQKELIEDVFSQIPKLKEMLNYTSCQQVRIGGFEADDILNTYAVKNKEKKVVIVTSDKDYYQLISDNCIIHDAMKKNTWGSGEFFEEYGFPVSSWIDFGALAGDTSDKIYSPDGWGEGTAKKYIREHLTVDNIEKHISEKKEVYLDMVKRKEAGEKILKKDLNKFQLKKVEENFLKFMPRIRLGQSLKKMDKLVVVPRLKYGLGNRIKLKDSFKDYGFITLQKDAWILTQ